MASMIVDNFAEQVKSLSVRVQKLKASPMTEEATKTSIIMPFFQVLGYDVFNPEEFLPEFVADVGIKKGEKVDYAVMENGKPLILIEAKAITEKLEKHDSQLYRYFGTTDAKFAILTNGLIYRFYTDLDELNKMDTRPFFEFDLSDIRDNQINELAKFRKHNFNLDNILNTASELKYTGEIKQFFIRVLDSPTDEFVSLAINDIYPGRKTRAVLDKFHELVKKSFRQMINEQVNDKLKAALDSYSGAGEEVAVGAGSAVDVPANDTSEPQVDRAEPPIVTTEEELEGYVIVRFLLRGVVEGDRVTYRDNQSYFNVLLDDNIRKWICRLGLNGSKKYIQLHDDDRTSFSIDRVSDIEKYQSQIITVAKQVM